MKKIIIVGIIILITIILQYIINFIYKKIEKKQKDIHLKFTKKIISVLILLLGLFAIGMQFELTKDLTLMILKCSSLFIAVAGFAAQQAIMDVLSGFMISWSKPFNIGERVTLVSNNITGIIEDITLRHTIIRLFDNNRLIIPNSIINKEIIKNSNYNDSIIGNFMEITISYDSDVNKAITVIESILKENSLIVNKENISILVKDFAASGIILKTTIWTKTVDDNFIACSDVRREILTQFKKEHLEIPYNKIEILDKKEDTKKLFLW